MGRLFFLGDVHTRGNDESFADFKRFSGFLERGDALYILGDFFDFFYGATDYVPSNYRPVLELFKTLSERGVRLFFVEGNREFFSKSLLISWGFSDVSSSFTLFLEGKVLVLHGDGISGPDWKYRLMKRALRNTFSSLVFRLLGPRSVYRMGFSLSKTPPAPSRPHEDYVGFAARLVRSGYRGVIMGHTHVKDFVKFPEGGFYANPGAWFLDKGFVVYEDGDFKLGSLR